MLGILTILALSGWPTADLRVETENAVPGAQARELRVRLADRLLDAGWSLAPTDADAAAPNARVHVLVTGDLARVSVEVGANEHVSFLRQPLGQVLGLDIALRVVESLDALAPEPPAQLPVGTRVGLVFAPDAPDRGEAALVLSEAGFWVVPGDGPASWRICVSPEHESYRVVRSRSLDCAKPWAQQALVAAEAIVAAVASQGEAIRVRSGPVDTDLQREVREALGGTQALSRSSRPRPPPNPRTVRTSAEAGFSAYQAVDPAIGARVDLGHRGGVVGSMRTSFWPSSGPEYRAVDTVVTAGVKLRGRIRTRFDAWVGVSAGVLVHRFDHDHEPVVTRVDPAFLIPIGVSYTGRRGVGGSLALNQGYSLRDRRYVRDAELIWTRPAYRVGLTFAVHFERVIR